MQEIKNAPQVEPRIFYPIDEIRNNPRIIRNYLKTTMQRRIFNVFLSLAYRYDSVFVSHKTIAQEARCSERSVLRCIPVLVKLGMLQYDYRHKRSSIYYISPFFKEEAVKTKLRAMFYACRKLSLYLLFATIPNYSKCVPIVQRNDGSQSYSLNEIKYNNTPLPPNVGAPVGGVENQKRGIGLKFKKWKDRIVNPYEEVKADMAKYSLNDQQVNTLMQYPLKSVRYALFSLKGNAEFVRDPFKYLLATVKNHQFRDQTTPQTAAAKPAVRAYPTYQHQEKVIDHQVESQNFQERKNEIPELVFLEEKLGRPITWQEVSANPLKYLGILSCMPPKKAQSQTKKD